MPTLNAIAAPRSVRKTTDFLRGLTSCLLTTFCFFSSGCSPPAPATSSEKIQSPPDGNTPELNTPSLSSKAVEPPRLVVWITVDQFRGDYLTRYQEHFGSGGFMRLVNTGTWYKNAHFTHAITETAPGHATLFTGASPSLHGIVGNTWLRPDGIEVASVTDASAPLLGPGSKKKPGPLDGRSPHLLMVPTIGDEMVRSTNGRAKVVGVSTKDRGAILPAGKSGTAYWMGSLGFVTSSYYGKTAPSWLHDHHNAHPPRSYLENGWTLAASEEVYQNERWHSPNTTKSLGSGFPYALPKSKPATSLLKITPFGDAAVLDLARRIVQEEKLGNDSTTDLLSVSLSSTDAIGHLFGPESREFEDQLLRLDRRLTEFFTFIDDTVGDQSVLYVLSADHGGCESAEHLSKLRLPGGRLTEESLMEKASSITQEFFGRTDLIVGVNSPYLFLNLKQLSNAGLNRQEVAGVIAEQLENHPGVHLATVTGPGNKPQALAAGLADSYYPGRSGDIYIVPDAYTLFLQEEALAATHGSPWNYDTHVPIVVSGASVPQQSLNRRVDVRSLAPTIARLIGKPAPPAAHAAPLLETIASAATSEKF